MSADDPELRRMLSLYREQRSPDAETRARVWEALDGKLAQPAPDASADAAPAVTGVPGAGVLVAKRLAVVVLLGVGAAVWFGTRGPSAPPPSPGTPPAASPSAHVSSAAARGPSATTPASPPSATRDALAAGAVASESTVRSAAPTPAHAEPPVVRAARRAAEPGSSLAAELALLQRAHAALDQGRAAHALRALRRHAARFEDGALAEERDAALVDALCRLGRAAEARRVADRFALRFPASPRVARVRAPCAPGAPEAP